MAQCTFGAQPKSGVGDYAWLTFGAFVTFITTKFPKLGILSFVPWSDILMSTADFCATEIVVPSVPGLTTWVNAFSGNLMAILVIQDYVQALFRQYSWSLQCECLPDPSPSATCYPHYTSDPGLADTATSSGWSWGFRFTPSAPCQMYGVRLWLTSSDTSPIAIRLWDCTTTGNKIFQSFPVVLSDPNPHTVYFDAPVDLLATHNYVLGYVVAHGHVMYASGGVSGTNGLITYGPNMIATDPNTLGDCVGAGDGHHYGIDAIICGSDPRGLIPFTPDTPSTPAGLPEIPDPTCTTTADLCARITQVEGELRIVRDISQYIAAAAAPTGYAMGTEHAGLTGSGTLAVGDIVGVLVESSVPTVWGRTLDVPTRFIGKLGAIHFGDTLGDLDENQIHYASQLVFGAPPITTLVSYSFRLGVTATVTELKRLK